MANFLLKIRYFFENDALSWNYFNATGVKDRVVPSPRQLAAPSGDQKPRTHTRANPIRRIWLKNTKAAITKKVEQSLSNLPRLQKELRAAASGATSPLFNDKPISLPGKDMVYNVRRVIMAYSYDMLRMYFQDQKGTQKFDVLGINPDDAYQILPLANEIATSVADILLQKDAFADYVINYYEKII